MTKNTLNPEKCLKKILSNLWFPLTTDRLMVKMVIALTSFGVIVGVILLGLTIRRTGTFHLIKEREQM